MITENWDGGFSRDFGGLARRFLVVISEDWDGEFSRDFGGLARRFLIVIPEDWLSGLWS